MAWLCSGRTQGSRIIVALAFYRRSGHAGGSTAYYLDSLSPLRNQFGGTFYFFLIRYSDSLDEKTLATMLPAATETRSPLGYIEYKE